MGSIREVIRSYKQRLIQTNSRNTSYFVSKLSDKRTIDLVAMWDEFASEEEEILPKLLSYERMLLVERKFDVDELKPLLLNQPYGYQDEVKEIIPYFYKRDFEILEKMSKDENVSYQEKAQIVNQLIDKYDKLSNRRFKAFSKLIKNQKAVIRDFGKNDLYLGFPFIVGKFDTGKMFRAPLVMHRVEIVESRSKITIRIVEDESIINPVFLTAFMMENKLKYRKIKWEIDSNDYLKSAQATLKEFGVNISNTEKQVSVLKSVSKTAFAEECTILRNSFEIQYKAVVGMFPLSNRNIFNDIEDLETTKLSTKESVGKFVLGDASFGFDDMFGEKEIVRPKEQEIKYITPLDWSQKNVLKEALDKNLVIEGPPGTGKSQTIVNIIINYVLKGEKVLVISEKVAAISVLYNRLGDLRDNTLIVKDHINDKLDFYEQINTSISNIVDKRKVTNNDEFDKVIEYHFDKLEKINQKVDLGDYSFKELVVFSSFYKNVKHKNEADIRRWTRSIWFADLADKDKDAYIKDLFSTENIERINQYKAQLKLNIYKTHTTSEIQELQTYYAISKDINLLKYYYSQKLELPNPIPTYSTGEYNSKQMDISRLHGFTKKIWNNRVFGEEYELILTNPITLLINANKKIVALIENWDNYEKQKDKLLDFKKIVDANFHHSFFDKLLSKKVILTEKEKDIYNTIDDNINDYSLDKLKNGKKLFNKNDLEVINLISKHHIQSESELINFLLISNYVLLTTNKDDKLLKFIEQQKLIDLELYLDCEKNVRKEDIALLDSMKITDFQSEEDFLMYFKVVAINKRHLQDTILLMNYFEDYQTNFQKTVDSFQGKMDNTRNFVNSFVKSNVAKVFRGNYEFTEQLKSLRRQAELKRKKSVKVTAKRYYDALHQLYPIWLMTPESASALLPLEKGIFDVVIFDEASQMFVERSIPSIYRAKRIVIAGDSEQLKPTSVFMSRFTEGDSLDDEDELDTEVIDALESESLLDHGKRQFPSEMLEYHYRSEYKELIDFSSNAFYHGRLRFASKCNIETKYPIETINVDSGRWINRKNVEEAETIYGLVKYLLENRKNNETIGIVTFNISQKDYIDELLSESEEEDILNEMARFNTQTKEDESLFVKNIENVQGDERDIIIFSIGYAKNEHGRVLNSFGSLNQSGGENRLNVAITRAKKKIYIVKSIHSSELSVNEKNAGPYFFKKYLQYAELLNSNDPSSANAILNQLNDTGVNKTRVLAFDSVFEEEVFDLFKVEIDQTRYEIHSQVNVGSFSIDLGVYDKILDQYILGIECDGATYHSSAEAVERDYYRQVYLENRGWVIHRIWSTNWWSNASLEIKKMSTVLDTVIEELTQTTSNKIMSIKIARLLSELKNRNVDIIGSHKKFSFMLGAEEVNVNEKGDIHSSFSDERSIDIIIDEVVKYYKLVHETDTATESSEIVAAIKMNTAKSIKKIVKKRDIFENSITCICGKDFEESLGECPYCYTNTMTIYKSQSN